VGGPGCSVFRDVPGVCSGVGLRAVVAVNDAGDGDGGGEVCDLGTLRSDETRGDGGAFSLLLLPGVDHHQ
jgi:hypothetical protein